MNAPGIDPSSTYSRHFRARFADFTDPKTPWSRRLWDLGTFLALEELYDSGIWMDRQVLAPTAVRWLARDLGARLGQDRALGTPELRRQLTQCLGSDLTVRSDGRRRLRQVMDLARLGYVDRWAALTADVSPPQAERAARAVTAHLLDAGHSLVGLRRWLTNRSGLSAVDLLTEAASLIDAPPRNFTIWVSVIELPGVEQLAVPLAHFRLRDNLDRHVREQFGTRLKKELTGAFRYVVQARDAERAVEVVAEVVARMRARSRFAGPVGRIVVGSSAYVEEERRFIELRGPRRGAAVMSLVAEGQLFAVGPADTDTPVRHAIDDALELAASLTSGALAPAISGSWSALEALLTVAKDTDEKEGKVVAATRAARLVACSWPRAELTALSYQIEPKGAVGEGLVARLDAAETNRDRSAIVAEELRTRRGLPLKRSWRLDSDISAVARMNALLDNPAAVLGQVNSYLEASLRRMYRCRNVIVHGGATRSDVLDSTLRVVAPLVGATLDRLAHAHLVVDTEPLHLATRADLAISMASDPDMGFHVVDLLGAP